MSTSRLRQHVTVVFRILALFAVVAAVAVGVASGRPPGAQAAEAGSGNTESVCPVTGTDDPRGPVIGVTDPGVIGPGFVLTPPHSGLTGRPGCATIPGSTVTNITPQSSGNCPQYDYQCEQQQSDQSCQLTAEQQQALAQQALAEQTELELLYQQLLVKALTEQATTKIGSTLLQQWLLGHTAATPADITDLLAQGAITPLDVALAAAQAISDLNEQTHRYAGTNCTDSPDDTTNSGQVNQNNSDPEPGAGNPGAASHTLPEVNPEAADTSVDMNMIEPQDYVIRDDDQLLYREDERAPEVIFSESFQPLDTSPAGQYDLADKVAKNKPGPYVSTTYDRGWVPGNSQVSETYLYVIDAQGGIDMNATLGGLANEGEMEVAFPGGIKTENIIGAYVYDGSGNPKMVFDDSGNSVQEFRPNRSYRGTRQAS
jgi:hypothetical protein